MDDKTVEKTKDYVLEYKIIPGLRSSSQLLYIESEQQIFRYKYTNNNIKYYYCYERNCNVGVAVENDNTKYCRKSGKTQVHNHGKQSELVKKLEVINSIKSDVKKAPIKKSSVRDIFDQNCKKIKNDDSCTVDYSRMCRQLHNIQQKNSPKPPVDFFEIIKTFKNEDVMKQFGMSRYESDKKFYVDTVITNNFEYAFFVSPTILNSVLSLDAPEQRSYIFDDTFNLMAISKEFKKLLIIYIIHADHAFPFLYILMSEKTEEAYIQLFKYLNAFVLDLQPTTIIADYKNSLRNAITKVYPQAEILGLWFHYINALQRKALKISKFQKHLSKDYEAKELYNKFLYLPLLKPEDIETAYGILATEAMSEKYFNSIDSASYFEPFVKYFDCQWITKETATNISVLYEPIRTYTSAEKFHNKFCMKTPRHGDFFKFLSSLCDLDAAKSSEYIKLSTEIDHCVQPNKFLMKRYQIFEEKKLSLTSLLEQLSKMKCFMIEEILSNIYNSDDDDEDDEPAEMCTEELTLKIEIDESD